MTSAEETLVQPSMAHRATTADPCMEATMPVDPYLEETVAVQTSSVDQVASVNVARQQVHSASPVNMPSNITFPAAVYSVSSGVATTDLVQRGVVDNASLSPTDLVR